MESVGIMKKIKKSFVILFILIISLVADAALFLLKKMRRSLYFPGG
jgi:hypothetical protein